MNKKTSAVKIMKSAESVKVLKEASTEFCVFGGDVVDFNKSVDRPDDYYVEGDEITFTITLKNIGEKSIINFALKDELEEFVLPFEEGFRVNTTIGQITSYDNPVTVNYITLKPEEEAIILITGIIGPNE